jgi:hypothetical protein
MTRKMLKEKEGWSRRKNGKRMKKNERDDEGRGEDCVDVRRRT